MTTTLLSAWQNRTVADVAALDAELGEILAAVRAFKAKATRLTRRVQRTSERIAGALHDAQDARKDDEMLPATEVLLDKLADLPSADPDDGVRGAMEALTEYRSELVAMARHIAAITS